MIEINFHKSEKLSSISGIVHGFSDREVGTNVSLIENYSKLNRIVQLKQIHSANVIILENLDNHNDLIEGDSLITNLKGVGIGIRTADCVPILITDNTQSIAAAVHAGWRGTLSEVVLNTVNSISSEFGLDASGLTAAIGPSIESTCYEIGEDVASLFKEKFPDSNQYISESGDTKYSLDLRAANRIALEKAGVAVIEIIDICTKCRQDFFSYRREGKGVSTQLSFIALSE